MKKIISVLLILVLCVGVLAACNNVPADLESAKTLLNKTYNTAGKGQENKITADKELTTIIAVDGARYQVAWEVKITTGKDGAVILTDSEKENSRLLKLVDQSEEVHFTLIATITNADGKSVTQEIACYAPKIEKVEIPTSEIFLYNPNDKLYVTAETYLYKSSSGTEKMELVVSADSGKAVALTVRENKDGTVTFVTSDNKYLYCDGTNVKFVDAEDEYTIFIIEGAEGGSYIKSVNGKYNDNNQYLELYSGYLTCYGLSSSSNVNLYTFQMVEAKVCEHEFKDVAAVEATCTTAGSTAGKECTKCGYTTGVETIKVLGHDWGDWEIVKEATETEDGTRKHTCKRCNESAEESYKLAKTEWVKVNKTPVEGTAYKFALTQVNLDNKVLYATGAMSGYFFATTENVSEAADLYVESVEGGYKLYFEVDGAKKYINVYEYWNENNAKVASSQKLVDTAEEASVFVWNAELNIYTVTLTNDLSGESKTTTYYLGTYSDYNTISASSTYYITGDNASNIGVSQFLAYLYVEQEVKEIVIPDGTYSIAVGGNYIGAVAQDKGYGYLPSSETAVAWTITNVDGGITIQDCYGRYVYMSGTYNNFNFSAEIPTEGHIFTVTKNADGTYTLVNVLMNKTLACDPTYGSLGAYADVGTYETKLVIAAAQAHTHEYTAVVTAPTCTTKGYTTYTCSCNDTYIADETDMLPHTEEVIPAVGATCTETGLTEGKKCSACGTTLEEQKIVQPIAHADNDNDGKCDTCDQSMETLCNHDNMTETVVPATCTEGGYTLHACTNCTYSYRDNETEKLGHDWGEWIIDTAATEESEGAKHRVCNRCTDVENEKIPKVEKVYSGIYWVSGNKYLTGKESYYEAKGKYELELSSNKADALKLEIRDNGNGTVTIVTADGKFLYCDGTDVKLVDEEGDYTLFEIEELDGGNCYIKSHKALFYEKPQYLEAWSGKLTSYSLGTGGDNFTFKIVSLKEEETPDEKPDETPVTPTGDTIVFDFKDLAVGGALNSEDALKEVFANATTSDLLSKVSGTSIYQGNSSQGGFHQNEAGYLKTGASKLNGQLVLTFADGVKVAQVKIYCQCWNTGTSDTVSINGSAVQIAPEGEGEYLVFNLTEASNVLTFDFAKRVFIAKIEITLAA